jgi:hypothetical protein
LAELANGDADYFMGKDSASEKIYAMYFLDVIWIMIKITKKHYFGNENILYDSD